MLLQVLEERIQHIEASPLTPEQYYQPTGCEVQPKPVGEEAGQVVFQYYPVSAVNYVSSSIYFIIDFAYKELSVSNAVLRSK